MTLKLPHKQGQIFKVGLSSTSVSKVLRAVRDNVLRHEHRSIKTEPVLISTPNPEIVLMASKDESLRKIINSFDFASPDGVGLAAASKFLSLKSPKNILFGAIVDFCEGIYVGLSIIFNRKWLYKDTTIIKGRELFIDLLKLANKKKWRVFLLGGDGAPKEAMEELEKSYKRVKIQVADAPKLNLEGKVVSRRDIKTEKDIISKINSFRPNMLFVGMTPPKQEKWIARNVSGLKTEMIMTVGGTFDYVGNRFPLPPAWMEKFGLEWLWRLFTQPSLKRAKRVLTAFPVFPLRVFWYKVTKK